MGGRGHGFRPASPLIPPRDHGRSTSGPPTTGRQMPWNQPPTMMSAKPSVTVGPRVEGRLEEQGGGPSQWKPADWQKFCRFKESEMERYQKERYHQEWAENGMSQWGENYWEQQNKVESLEMRKYQLEKELGNMASKYEQLESQNSELHNRVSSLQRDLGKKDFLMGKMIIDLKSDLQAITQEKDNLTLENYSLKTSLDTERVNHEVEMGQEKEASRKLRLQYIKLKKSRDPARQDEHPQVLWQHLIGLKPII